VNPEEGRNLGADSCSYYRKNIKLSFLILISDMLIFKYSVSCLMQGYRGKRVENPGVGKG
jgi:hypothetical protein